MVPIYESDDKVFLERTGKSVSEWNKILEDWGGLKKGHVKMATHLEQKYDLTPEWASAVSVRYQKEAYM